MFILEYVPVLKFLVFGSRGRKEKGERDCVCEREREAKRDGERKGKREIERYGEIREN